MEELIESFLEYLEKNKNYTLNTLSSYKGDLDQLRTYLKGVNPITEQEPIRFLTDVNVLSGYMQNLKEKSYALSTLARKIASVKSFIKYLIDIGKIKNDKAPNLASPQVNKSITKPLSVLEIRQLLSEPAKFHTVEAKRDKAMLELLYATGLRASELMALDTKDIDLEKNNITCRKVNSKTRVISIDNVIARIINDYINEARVKLLSDPNEVALFLNRRGERLTRQGFWQIIQGYAERIGLGKKVTPRSLRSSFVIHKLNSGTDLESLQELMGHAHISTTKAYQDARLKY